MSEISEAIKQKAAEMEAESDLITIPRGLLGAALAVIKRPERDSANVIELLRYYAFAKEAPVALRERAEPDYIRYDCGCCGWETIEDWRDNDACPKCNHKPMSKTELYAAPPAPVDVPNELVSELLDIAKRAAEEADECANAEFSDNSMKHAREIAEWERRAAMLNQVQPVAETDTTSQQYGSLAKDGE
ncbi:hypothetical protein C5946_01095 [Cronobacter sakazakii]|uniref:hypothetical protein n=1 Tax=Cronobacter sakazakii TaxID=28141 RepID=UPI000CF08B48|nr:hypothetical protein [Cronobacter sakazakii]PPY39089.1 hypothetical protein C3D65_10065 [Cronobacter sakazakii]PPY51739.1 hypothetical protein C3D64_04825 [Cronobacter sakazakii]PQY10689.1 hypothetical protein C5956_05255 [Cronobacter sakazakii]PQY32906.1 hypothetical protein C5946_01095 [Cronobacter sakazakii]